MNKNDKESVNSSILSTLQGKRLNTYSILGITSIAFEVKELNPPIEENDNLFSIEIIRGNYDKNDFTERFSDFEISGEYHITGSDIYDLKKREEIELQNGPIIWITELKDDGSNLTLKYEPTDYYKKYSLNKQMYCKFPNEENYPIKILLEAIPDFEKGNYNIIKKLPLSIGSEVSVVTSDNKYNYRSEIPHGGSPKIPPKSSCFWCL